MQIDFSDEQPQNTDLPIIESWLSFSNVTLERDVQDSKHDSEIVSMDEGIQIDSRAEHRRNADSPSIET
jgi:hypothetical protein